MTIGGVFSASVFKSTVYKTGVSPLQNFFDTHDGFPKREQEYTKEEYEAFKNKIAKESKSNKDRIARQKQQSDNRKQAIYESIFGKPKQIDYEPINNHYKALNSVLNDFADINIPLMYLNSDKEHNIEVMRQLLSMMKIIHKLDDYDYSENDDFDTLMKHYNLLMETIDE